MMKRTLVFFAISITTVLSTSAFAQKGGASNDPGMEPMPMASPMPMMGGMGNNPYGTTEMPVTGKGGMMGSGYQEEGANPNPTYRQPMQPQPRARRLPTIGGGECPFRPNSTEVQTLWDTAREALSNQQAKDQGCQNALQSMTASFGNAELARPNESAMQLQLRLENAEARVITLSAANDPAQEFALQEAQETVARLEAEIRQNGEAEHRRAVYAAKNDTINRVNAVLSSLPGIQNACRDADANIAQRAAQTGLGLFSAASPLIFGPGTAVNVIADSLSKLVGAFVGPSRAERGLQYLTRAEDLKNLSCFYFHAQKTYCSMNTEAGDPNRVAIEDLRRLFEDQRENPIGRRLRSVFNQQYGDLDQNSLGRDQQAVLPQYCALLSTIPGRSRNCTPANTAGLGPTLGSCAYIEYYTAGTAGPNGSRVRIWPTARPSGALSTSTSGGGGSR